MTATKHQSTVHLLYVKVTAVAAMFVCLLAPLNILLAVDECVTFGKIPTPGVSKWTSVKEMCEAGKLLPEVPADLFPPAELDTLEQKNAYSARVKQFLAERKYLEWIGDANWRFTGDVEGCPGHGALSFGTHNIVRIWYSRPVIEWLCDGRRGELPDGAMIVKEEHFMNEASKVIADPNSFDPETGTYNMGAPQDLTDAPVVVPMIKRKSHSFDGWYWGGIGVEAMANPPLEGASAFGSNPPVDPTEPDPEWYPTGANRVQPNVLYPNTGFGMYCVNCHAAAESESTFSTINNIMGYELVFKWRGEGLGPMVETDNPFPRSLSLPNPAFLETFPELGPPSFQKVWQRRYPAESYDRVVSGEEGPQQFVTSDQCVGCHQATANNSGQLWNMVLVGKDRSQYNLAPDAEWRWSPMSLAARDPIFLAELESELNEADEDPDLVAKTGCVENLCFRCHSPAAQRQLALDTSGQGPPNTLCNPLLPKHLRGDPSKNGPLPFTRDMLTLWDGSGGDPTAFKYGALGRDGVSCTVCHRTTDEGFDTFDSFTGNLKLGPPDVIYGPFPNPQYLTMQRAIGASAVEAPWIKRSALCGSCHTVYVPVLGEKGKVLGFDFDQTTYLEWLNSDFANASADGMYGPKTCQDCHMPNTFHRGDESNNPLEFKIANIEDDTLPLYHNMLPLSDITLPVRKDFARHSLHGLNIVLNATAQQFPLLMGLRQLDFWNPKPLPPLLNARDSIVHAASNDTAEIAFDDLIRTAKGLKAAVIVRNKTGHNFPSGVAFRRAFIEFRVLDADKQTLWVSGSTNSVGVIVDGATGEPLKTEFLIPKRPGGKSSFQKHHKTIKRQNQVQIYEQLNKDVSGSFTTSILRTAKAVKDNRLRPKGWRRDGPFARETKPKGRARRDRDYRQNPNQGEDRIIFKVKLPKDKRERIDSVQVRLYYQSTPPYYLAHRFLSGKDGPRSQDTKFFYYLASHLDTDATDSAGRAYFKDWKLQVGPTLLRDVPTR